MLGGRLGKESGIGTGGVGIGVGRALGGGVGVGGVGGVESIFSSLEFPFGPPELPLLLSSPEATANKVKVLMLKRTINTEINGERALLNLMLP